jgi:ketosteroid isomerase-like protein
MSSDVSAAADEVRAVVDAWFDAIRRRDPEDLAASHSEAIVMFDVPPPTALTGIEAYRESWPQFFAAMGEEGFLEPVDLHIEASDDVAFVYATLRCRADGHDFPVRLTIGLRHVGDEWIVLHEHHSVPAGS